MNGLSVRNKKSLEELKAISIPEATETFQPIGHGELVDYMTDTVPDLLGDGYSLINNVHGTANKDQMMFGLMTFKNHQLDVGMSVGYRNSLDKSLSVGLAFGANVFVCENLMMAGDVYVMQKHTTNVWQNLEATVMDAVPNAHGVYETLVEDIETMSNITIDNDKMFQILGLMRGHNVLNNQQLNIALKETINPNYKEHKNSSLMQTYNACTEALKTQAWPNVAMSTRMKLHELMKTKVIPALS